MGTPGHPPQRPLKVLPFDGAKVHDFLFHAALAEIWWQDLRANPQNLPTAKVQTDRARARAAKLYQEFLAACHQGPKHAITFLAGQHDLQKRRLQESQAMLQSRQAVAARWTAMLGEVAFGAQFVKSTCTAGVAIIGMLLVGTEAVIGAGIGLGYDVLIEFIKHPSHAHEPPADAVVVGFKQNVANDSVGVAGTVKVAILEGKKEAMMKTLAYPLKSSKFRAAASTATRLDRLLKALGVLALGVTIYMEYKETRESFDQMQKARESAKGFQPPKIPQPSTLPRRILP